jgi:hypothetical protein
MVTLEEGGNPVVRLSDASGKVRILLAGEEKGKPVLLATDEEGKPAWKAP